ncbi:MAG: hypothetical protein KFB96_00625 [Thiocapsa sp.]|uniref:hypothetical protein n=1 Tax=Thiocapsa sp. TaxID=2024551 RepID=UPI001BD17E15|nr:hypothetical protein [Thiocapsa sp.]QVL49080.1 MAG: hypothetical protein KFB96_00625 [Thiocapsa sp.]
MAILILDYIPRHGVQVVITPEGPMDIIGLNQDDEALLLGVVLRVTEGLDGVPDQGIRWVGFRPVVVRREPQHGILSGH